MTLIPTPCIPSTNMLPNKTNITKYKTLLLVIPAVISWGLAFPFIKLSLNELTPINLTIMRFFITCSIIAVFMLFKSKTFSKLHKKDIPKIIALGFFGIIVYHLGLNYGEQYISAGAASLIIATIPLFIVILASIFLDEHITPKKITGIILAFIGISIISLWGQPNAIIEINYITGAITVVIAALMGALYTTAGKRLLNRYSALSLTFYAMLFGSIGLLPLLNTTLVHQVATMSPITWFAVIFLGLFSTVIAYTLWYVILQASEASQVGVYLYLIPIVSILVDVFVFHEPFTWLFILGGILVMTGVIIVNYTKQKRAA